jgi:hypothetical protein
MTDLQRYDRDGIELIINFKTGEAFASQAGYARMSGKSYDSIRKRVERLSNSSDTKELKIAEIQTGYGIQNVTLIPIEIVLDWLVKENRIHLIFKLTDFVFELTGKRLNIPNINNGAKINYKNVEKKEQVKLCLHLDGVLEVPCLSGRIDILTSTEIIEVKLIKNWKAAIGQVLVYNLEYPDKTPRIHLCGECSEEYKTLIEVSAAKLNVKVSFQMKH